MVGSGSDAGDWSEEFAEADARGGDEPSAAAPMDDSVMPNHPQGNALEGGEVDDNEDYAEFLEYVSAARDRLGDDPAVEWLDVTERQYIRVVDSNGRHVPDATVIIASEGDDILGRTRANGDFAFFPAAYGTQLTGTALAWSPVGEGEALLDDEDTVIVLDGVRDEAQRVDVDVAFVIDATGSMSEEIARIKTTVTDIAAQISSSEGVGTLRFGLVDYRDRGDAYVTHTVDFTDDIQAFESVVNTVQAGGGGDFPEELNAALHETMRRLDWRRANTLRVAFVVADAPAHYYEQQEYTYANAMLDAAAMGVKVFPIASGGSDPVAELQFRQLAQFTQGHFVFITEGQGSTQGSGGSTYDVDESQFQVERLDALLVRLVSEEVEDWLRGVDLQFL